MRGTRTLCTLHSSTELGFPPELETTESDMDDQTSASDEEADAVIDYQDADSRMTSWRQMSLRLVPKLLLPGRQQLVRSD